MLLNLYVYTINEEDGYSFLDRTEGEAKRCIRKEFMSEGDKFTHFDLMGTDYDTDDWYVMEAYNMPDYLREELEASEEDDDDDY